MNLSEQELFQILCQRYQAMQNSKSNTARNYAPVEEVLKEFTDMFYTINNTHTFKK